MSENRHMKIIKGVFNMFYDYFTPEERGLIVFCVMLFGVIICSFFLEKFVLKKDDDEVK